MNETYDVVIVGAGQAGLSLSYELSRSGTEHIILERGSVGESWRSRWDSFCLVLPNWTIKLAGREYDGHDPDGFMTRDAFVEYIKAYATSFSAPVREEVTVHSLERRGDSQFLLRTSDGDITARQVVLATGGFQKPYRPPGVNKFPASVAIIDSQGYTSPHSLPEGKVLVIGSGQTGCQIAEELRQTGREVVVACGRAPWLPRRIGDRDAIAWLVGTPFMNVTLEELPNPMARLVANPQVSGRSGGHDLNYRTLQAMGVILTGHLLGAQDGRAHFAPDLAASVAFGDARYSEIREIVMKSAVDKGLPAPEMPDPPPFVANATDSVDLAEFGAAVVTTGFRPDYKSWVHFPEAFDEMGFPIQTDGASTTVPSLHFMGVQFMRCRASATLIGVGEDAALVADRIARPRESA